MINCPIFKLLVIKQQTHFEGAPPPVAAVTTLPTVGTTLSRGGTVPTNLLALSPLDAVTVVLLPLVVNIDNLSFLIVVILLLLLDGDDDIDAANRLFDANGGEVLLVPILFGRLELDAGSEKWFDLALPLFPEPPL